MQYLMELVVRDMHVWPAILVITRLPASAMSQIRRTVALMDWEYGISATLLAAVLLIGLVTARDYGITTDEFIFDEYGPKALAWYASGFRDRTMFDYDGIALYGPWFQICVAVLQSHFRLIDPFTVRHALTFTVGLAGIAALLPIGRLTLGRWAGLTAIVLCLLTGNVYGHLFFTPNDIPFLSAMTWATLAVIAMARSTVPTWFSTIAAGLLTGLAIATRFGGLLTQVYLIGAVTLCAIELRVNESRYWPALRQLILRSAVALVLGWMTAIVLWPWLQTTDPVGAFKDSYDGFVTSHVRFLFQHWGETVRSDALPWHYIPGQLLARLPEGFVILLLLALVLGLNSLRVFVAEISGRFNQYRLAGLAEPMLQVARARGFLIILVAALIPPIFIVVRGAIIFDGIRHVLFIVPPLAVLAAWGLLQSFPMIIRFPRSASAIAGLQVAMNIWIMAALHPLEYVAFNSFAGGTAGAFGRFDLDYWSAAATEAVRRLHTKLIRDIGSNQTQRPLGILICIGWREHMVQPMLPKSWTAEPNSGMADYTIQTERWQCGNETAGVTVDSVDFFGRTFAKTIQNSRRANQQ